MPVPRQPGAEACDRESRIAEAGLCARCRHARVQRNPRGSRFWRCGRAEHDSAYLRYPPLPVTRCPGFQAALEDG